jgi:tetratricopeptide (TPR) repeat protein
LYPEDPIILCWLSKFYQKTNKYDTAMKYIDMAIAVAPSMDWAREIKGFLYNDFGIRHALKEEWREAVRYGNLSVPLVSGLHADILANLAGWNFRLGRLSAARKNLLDALEYNPKHAASKQNWKVLLQLEAEN